MPRIRPATVADAAACARIYAPHVQGSATSFEAVPPDAAELARRIHTIGASWPWLVAEEQGEVLGYAYAGPFRDRAAYDWTCESTVYVGAPRRGLGRALMQTLIQDLRERGYCTVVAGITLPNDASVGLHEVLSMLQTRAHSLQSAPRDRTLRQRGLHHRCRPRAAHHRPAVLPLVRARARC